ncbi:MAG TPA: DUF3455 domain-containing protein [Candidatus Acidoferrales bacterium]|nr:DUF3455 domain-containing protein [Candidatus Acidoferrales bacterium]
MTAFTEAIVFFAVLSLLTGQGKLPEDVPENLKAPAGEELVLVAHATGSQIYVCQAGTDQKFSFVLKAPEAKLLDAHGDTIGSHYGGPAWKLNDGSEVTGKMLARHDAPDAGSIPWLLVTVAGHSGSGLLSRVTTIQRLHTKGGQAPSSGCEESKKGAEIKVPYTADYYFYAPARGEK